MNKLILCEGESDAILLSYYLGSVCGWKFVRQGPQRLEIKTSKDNQSANWYKNDAGDYLLICGVGGKDNFSNFFEEKIKHPILLSNAFSKIALIVDKDNDNVNELEKNYETVFNPIISDIKNNEWIKNTYNDSYKMKNDVEFLFLVIPEKDQGALETLMLKSISLNPYDKKIVDKCGEFVEEMKDVADKYICSNRLKLKAHLSTTWAIQSPQKVFTFIDEQIRSVKWEESKLLKECFAELIKI